MLHTGVQFFVSFFRSFCIACQWSRQHRLCALQSYKWTAPFFKKQLLKENVYDTEHKCHQDRWLSFLITNQMHYLTKIYSVVKLFHVSGNFFAHHHEFSTVHSALVSFMQVFDDRFEAESGWNCSAVPSWLCLEAVIRNLHETYQRWMYSRKLLMMGREDARNM